MADKSKPAMSALPFLPARVTMTSLREAARHCQGCPLYQNATQTVFGAGRRSARVFLVGEQPGNDEDLQGKPFVGPAGRVLDKGLEEAGIDRADAYVTNVVKHFKWEPRGKRRKTVLRPDRTAARADRARAAQPWPRGPIRVTLALPGNWFARRV